MLKKLISIFLLIILMLYSVGYYISYRYNIKSVKNMMRAAIASKTYHPEQLFTIQIPLENGVPTAMFFEKEDTHEFRFHGEMYDIVSTQWLNNSVVYTCINDREENHLITVFTNEAQKQAAHPLMGKKSVHLLKFSYNSFTVSEAFVLQSLTDRPSQISFYHSSEKLYVAYASIPSPPPWHALI